jgi:GT2 family glycosyltransferase
MTVTAILPTKNRPRLLADAVRTLLAQTVVPQEIVVVDQSAGDEGRRLVRELVAGVPAPRRPALVYVWDPAISGAAAARNAGLDLARGELVVFVDDDVVPAADVLERLLQHYARSPELAGIAPVITNYPPPGRVLRLADALFCLGPFRDERQPVYWHWRRYAGALVPVRMFTGAMMSFRRTAVEGLRFDARYRAASVGEDVDLCWALGARGGRLAIATDAHIVHEKAPRPAARPEAAQITSWAFVYDKHVRKTPAARLAFAWFVAGHVLGALVATVREWTWAPLASAVAGVRGIFTDYAGSTFLAPRAEAERAPAPATASPAGGASPRATRAAAARSGVAPHAPARSGSARCDS